MIKKFLEWIKLKQSIDKKSTPPPLVNESDMWWTSVGENIGFEISGKSQKFSRPVIIFKKLSRKMFLVIPTTTKVKEGTWYVTYKHKFINEVACLHQIRTIDYRRLLSKMGEMDKSDFLRVQDGFEKLYVQKCVPPPFGGGVAGKSRI